LWTRVACPGCRQQMRLVGTERPKLAAPAILTYQCECGQIISSPRADWQRNL